MSDRFKLIDFIDFYITKKAKPEAPIAEGTLAITYLDNVYEGDEPRKIADLLMTPDNTALFDELEYTYSLVPGEGDTDNSDLYIVGRELFSSVPIRDFTFRVGAAHLSGYVEGVKASVNYGERTGNTYESFAGHFDGTNYVSSDGADFAVTNALSTGAVVTLEEPGPPPSTASITYRIHEFNSTYPPNVTITNATELTYDSDTAGICGTFTIVHVSKSDIDGKKLYWSSDLTSGTSSAITRGLSIYDGHLSTTDPTIFINGSPANGGTLIGDVLDSYTRSQGGIKSTSNNIPDLSSYGNNISFIVHSKDYWIDEQIVFDLFALELREQNETVITAYDILGTIAETGTDGDSSYGTIGSSAYTSEAPSTQQTILSKGTVGSDGYSLMRNSDNTVSFNLVTGSGGTYPINSANPNGTSQYFEVVSTSDNDVTTGNLSLSIWIKTGATGFSKRIIDKTDPSNVRRGYSLYVNSSGELRLSIGGDEQDSIRTSTTTGLGIDDNEWHYVLVFSNIGNPATMYVDGLLQSTSYSSSVGTVGTLTNTGVYTVGRRNSVEHYWPGELALEEFAYGDLTSYVSELYNGGTPLCPDKYSTGLKTAINEGHTLANWDGNTDNELIGHKGLFDLVNVGSTPFTGTGLSVECGSSTSTTITSSALTLGTPYAIDATYDSTEGIARLYVDRSEVAASSANPSPIKASSEDLKIGEGLTGCLQFPYVSDRKFSASEIAALSAPQGLIPYYDLSTSITDDMLGHWNVSNWNNGKNAGQELLNNVPATGGVLNYPVNSADIDSGKRFVISSAPTLTNFSASIWVKINNVLSTDDYIFGNFVNVDYKGWHITTTTGLVRFYIGDTSNVQFVNISQDIRGSWHLLTVTYDGADMRLYIDDGTSNSSKAVVGGVLNSTDDIRVSSNENDLRHCDMGTSFARVWDRTLSPLEVANQIDTSGGAICFGNLPTGLQSGLVISNRLGNWGTNAGDELINQGSAGTTTTAVGAITYTDQGLTVECDGVVTNDLTANGTVNFDCDGEDVFDSEGPYTPPDPPTPIVCAPNRVIGTDNGLPSIIFEFNWTPVSSPVLSATIAQGNPATVTTSSSHGYTTGDLVVFTGTSTSPTLEGPCDNNYAITVTSPTTFTLDEVSLTSGSSGSIRKLDTRVATNVGTVFNGERVEIFPVSFTETFSNSTQMLTKWHVSNGTLSIEVLYDISHDANFKVTATGGGGGRSSRETLSLPLFSDTGQGDANFQDKIDSGYANLGGGVDGNRFVWDMDDYSNIGGTTRKVYVQKNVTTSDFSYSIWEPGDLQDGWGTPKAPPIQDKLFGTHFPYYVYGLTCKMEKGRNWTY